MDDLDSQLVHALTQDARQSASDLGRQLGVSRITVQKRIDRLLDQGVISRFTVELGKGVDNPLVEALVLVKLTAGDSRPFVTKIRKSKMVQRVDSLNGSFDFAIEICVPGLRALDEFLAEIRRYHEVAETDCSIRLNRFQ